MKIAHLSTGVEGGADIAAARIHKLLLRGGHQSRFYHYRDQSPDTTFERLKAPAGFARSITNRFDKKKNDFLFGHINPTSECFTNPWGNSPTTFADLRFPDVDIITFHWVSAFIDLEPFLASVPKHVKFIWVLHDLNPLTGGCHYTAGCRKFEVECYQCPQLLNDGVTDLAKKNFKIKRDTYNKYLSDRLYLVPDSNWVASEVRSSALLKDFPLTVVHYPIETEVFRPHDKHEVRKVLGLENDKVTLLFGSSSLQNSRKGIDLLFDSLKELVLEYGPDRLQLITFGSGQGIESISGVGIKNFGRVSGKEFLALLYNAADYYMMPSREEALGQTAMESLCCGTPVVSFAVGGLLDTVNKANGVFSEAMTASSLAGAIRNAINTKFDRQAISVSAHKQYSFDVKQAEYVRVYEGFF